MTLHTLIHHHPLYALLALILVIGGVVLGWFPEITP